VSIQKHFLFSLFTLFYFFFSFFSFPVLVFLRCFFLRGVGGGRIGEAFSLRASLALHIGDFHQRVGDASGGTKKRIFWVSGLIFLGLVFLVSPRELMHVVGGMTDAFCLSYIGRRHRRRYGEMDGIHMEWNGENKNGGRRVQNVQCCGFVVDVVVVLGVFSCSVFFLLLVVVFPRRRSFTIS
jgi:hypothetical protein